jgi:hypothetical protein
MGDTTHSRDSPAGPTTAGQRPVRPARLLAAAGLWVGLVVVALLNAGFREVVLAPSVGDYVAHVTSTGTLLTAVAVIAYLYFGRYTDHSVGELVAIGLAWTALTVLFEFGFGHYVMGTPWHVLVADYNLLAGRVWLLVPLSMAAFPLLFGRVLRQ